MHLGSSEILTPWKIFKKMLTHEHKMVNTWWCYHICEEDGVWGIERGLALLWKWNAYFSLCRRQRNEGERKSLGWPDAWPNIRSDVAGASSQFNRQTHGAECEGLWLERSITRGTDASDHTPRRATWREGLIGRGGTSGHMRSDTFGRQNRSLDPYWTQTECQV
jgi:hypothetical protein